MIHEIAFFLHTIKTSKKEIQGKFPAQPPPIYQKMLCIRIFSQYFSSVNFGQKSSNLHPQSPHVYATNEVLRVYLNRMP